VIVTQQLLQARIECDWVGRQIFLCERSHYALGHASRVWQVWRRQTAVSVAQKPSALLHAHPSFYLPAKCHVVTSLRKSASRVWDKGLPARLATRAEGMVVNPATN